MPMYIFYPCLEDGSPTSFEAFELDGDDAAREQGERVLGDHASATHVMVWRDGRALTEIRRDRADTSEGPDDPSIGG